MEPSTWIKDTGSPSAGHPFSSLNPNASEFIPRFNSAPVAPQQPSVFHQNQNISLIRPCLPPGYTIVPPIPQVSNADGPSFGYQPFSLPPQMSHVVDTSFKVPDSEPEHWVEDKKESEETYQQLNVEDNAKTENFQPRTNYGFNRGGSRGYKHSTESYRQRTDPDNFRSNINQRSWDENGKERQQEQLRNQDRNYRERGNRLNDRYQHDIVSGEGKTDEKRKENNEQHRNHERIYRGGFNNRGRSGYRPNSDRREENDEEQHRNYERNYRGGVNNRGRSGYRSNSDRRDMPRHQNDFHESKFEIGNDWRDINEENPHESHRPYNSNYRGGFNRSRGGQRWNRSTEETCSYQDDKRIEVVKNEIVTEQIQDTKSGPEDSLEKHHKLLRTQDRKYRGKERGGYRSNRGREESRKHQHTFSDEKIVTEDAKEKKYSEGNHECQWEEHSEEKNKDKNIVRDCSDNRWEPSSHHHQNNMKAKEDNSKDEWGSVWEENSKEKLLEEQITTHHQRRNDDTRQNEFEENTFGPVSDKEKTEDTRNIIKEEKHHSEEDSVQKNSMQKSENQRQITRDKSSPKIIGGRGNTKPATLRFERQNRGTEGNGSEQDTKNLARRGRFLNNRDFSKNQDFKPKGKSFANRGKFGDRNSFKSIEAKSISSDSEAHLIASESNITSEIPLEKDEMNRSWIQEVMEEDERNSQEQTQDTPQPLSWRTRDNGGPSDPNATDRHWDKEKKTRRSWERPNGDNGSWRERSNTIQGLYKYRDPRMEREKRNSNPKLTEFEQWDKQWMTMQQGKIIQEIEGDLFDQPKEFSLAHCVAEDFRMGSGIAVAFKREFGNLAELLDQRVTQGGLATLFNDEHQRFIYYLVTKKGSTGKPTYEDLWQSLCKLRDHIKEHKVTKLAMPRLGCGLDRLEWNKVKAMIVHLFDNVDVDIWVCHLVQNDSIEEKKSNTCKLVVEDNTAITKIDAGTLLLYFSDTEGTSDDTMLRLSKKFNFMEEFNQQKPKSLGDIVYFDDSITNFGICGCIVREAPTEPINFKALYKCLKNINKKNKLFGDRAFAYVAIQWVNEEAYLDETVNQKIITMLINILRDTSVHVCKGSFEDEGE